LGRGDVESSLVWLLGSPRTGSTWLLNLLRIDPRVSVVDEPAIGSHLGLFAADVMGSHPVGFDRAEMLLTASRAQDDQYFFCSSATPTWGPHLRRLLLDRLGLHLRDRTRGSGLLVIKEPAGSQSAELILSVLPKSRLLFLVRDGRDVIDSEIDAVQKGGWLAELFKTDEVVQGDERLRFVESQAHRWVARTEAVERAFLKHPPALRHRVSYETLIDDTYGAVSGILEWLGSSLDSDVVRRHVERLSFDALPEGATGPGRFARAASPGLWRTNLTPPEQTVVNKIMGATLHGLGYPD
jgi:hypothetical protein